MSKKELKVSQISGLLEVGYSKEEVIEELDLGSQAGAWFDLVGVFNKWLLSARKDMRSGRFDFSANTYSLLKKYKEEERRLNSL